MTLEFPKGAEGLRIEFDRQCSTERRHDPLTIMDGANRIVSVRSGNEHYSVDESVASASQKLMCMRLLCVFQVGSGLIGPVS